MLEENYHRRCFIQRIVDGDTIECWVDLGWGIRQVVTVRIQGVDTAELRPRYADFATPEEREAHIRAAYAAMEAVVEWMEQTEESEEINDAWPYILVSESLDPGSGKFGRSLGDLWSPTLGLLSEWLIQGGHSERL